MFTPTKEIHTDADVIKLSRVLPKTHPFNESYEHYFCKTAARIIAYRMYNCRIVGLEVPSMKHYDVLSDKSGRVYGNKSIIDACGIRFSNQYTTDDMGRWMHDYSKASVYGFESKVSINDYRNGFSAKCPYTFIVCPTGIVPVDELPPKIGLIYVDLENFAYIRSSETIFGVQVVKRASRRLDGVFGKREGTVEKNYGRFVLDAFELIGRRNTIEATFNPIYTPCYEYAE